MLLFATGVIKFSIYDTVPVKWLNAEYVGQDCGANYFARGNFCQYVALSDGNSVQYKCPDSWLGQHVEKCQVQALEPNGAEGPVQALNSGELYSFSTGGPVNLKVLVLYGQTAYAGNGICDNLPLYQESCQTAPQDCGTCAGERTTTTLPTPTGTTLPGQVPPLPQPQGMDMGIVLLFGLIGAMAVGVVAFLYLKK